MLHNRVTLPGKGRHVLALPGRSSNAAQQAGNLDILQGNVAQQAGALALCKSGCLCG